MTVCEVCGAAGEPVGYAGLRRCAACAHVWADLSMSRDDLHRLYQRGYFFGDEYSNYVEDRSTLERNFAGRLATLQRFMKPDHRRLFEVGCAYGFFLNAARKVFPEVAGIDVSADAVSYATRELSLQAACGDVLDSPRPERPYDVVCLWDTIEHLAHPKAYIEKAAEITRPGGLLAITTGDIGSLNARIQRGRWRLIHPPTHLHYFTQASMASLLDRCGFNILHVEHCGMYRSVGGMFHNVVALRWGWRRLGEWLRAMTPARLDAYVNLNDIMYIVAERR